jgi:hypothetical protein
MTVLRKFGRGGRRQACRGYSILGPILLFLALFGGGCSCRRVSRIALHRGMEAKKRVLAALRPHPIPRPAGAAPATQPRADLATEANHGGPGVRRKGQEMAAALRAVREGPRQSPGNRPRTLPRQRVLPPLAEEAISLSWETMSRKLRVLPTWRTNHPRPCPAGRP